MGSVKLYQLPCINIQITLQLQTVVGAQKQKCVLSPERKANLTTNAFGETTNRTANEKKKSSSKFRKTVELLLRYYSKGFPTSHLELSCSYKNRLCVPLGRGYFATRRLYGIDTTWLRCAENWSQPCVAKCVPFMHSGVTKRPVTLVMNGGRYERS